MAKKMPSWTNIIVTVTTIIFAVTSLITVYVTLKSWEVERESSRPYLTFKESPALTIHDQEIQFKFDFVNVGPHPAANLSSLSLIFQEQLQTEPIHIDQKSLINQIPYNTATSLIINVHQPGINRPDFNLEPHYIIIDLQYTDLITDQTYHQTLYLRWLGVIDGEIQPIFYAELQIQKDILDYLKKFNIDPKIDRWNIS